MSTRISYPLAACIMLFCLGGCTRHALDQQLVAASASGNVQDIKRLLLQGANINSKDGSLNGWTPLIWALYEDHDDAALALLAAGADPNIRDGGGKTALFFAQREGDHSVIIRALIRAGAQTEQYMALFGSLSPSNSNRIAFIEALGPKFKKVGP